MTFERSHHIHRKNQTLHLQYRYSNYHTSTDQAVSTSKPKVSVCSAVLFDWVGHKQWATAASCRSSTTAAMAFDSTHLWQVVVKRMRDVFTALIVNPTVKAEENPSYPKVCGPKSGMCQCALSMVISVPWAGTAQMTTATVSSVAIAPKTHDVMELQLLRVYQTPNYTQLHASESLPAMSVNFLWKSQNLHVHSLSQPYRYDQTAFILQGQQPPPCLLVEAIQWQRIGRASWQTADTCKDIKPPWRAKGRAEHPLCCRRSKQMWLTIYKLLDEEAADNS